ncbi:NACHT, LRR and PYD domains-containing protein 3-like isoform X1 [Poecilia formosa]|uniref:NACHT, LRR and PYD domains-containing protein 3-like n=1 Tax=Poecilia formosa TaxID=48698 RepID=A0A087XCM0_POEFO|nr:PREDICTED: NACHT, LRR and PYD domains-containing protein 3-like isoform X1 [Poecilia formosa]
MSQSEETKEASVPMNDSLSYENGTEVGPQRNEEKNSTSDSQRLSLKNQKSMDNPLTFQKEDGASMTEQTKLPMKQNKSLDYPIGFKHLMRRTISSPTPSVVSLKSNDSMDYPVNFKRSSFSGFRYKTGNSSTPSVVSLKSNDSMDYPVNFKGSSSSGFGQKMGNSSTPSIVSLKSNDSMDYPVNFKSSSSPGFGQKMGHSSTPSSVSLKSNDSMDYPVNFKGSSCSGFGQKMRNSSTPSVVSLKSNDSMDYPVNFKGSSSSGSDDKILEETSSFHGDLHKVFERLERETVTLVRSELKKLHQMLTPNYPKPLWTHDVIGDVFHCEEREKILTGEEEEVMNFLRKFLRMMKLGDFADALSSSHSVRSPSKDNNESHVTKISELDDQQLKSESNKLRPQLRIPPKEDMDTTFKNLEGNIVVFVENELRSFHKLLNRETVHSQDEDEEVINWEEEEQKKVTKEAFLDMIVTFLRRMKQEELAFALLNKSVMSKCQSKLKSNLKMRLAYVLEGIAKEGHPTLLNKIYTDLYITEGREEVICDHEVKHFEKALKKRVKPLTIRREELFKPITGRDKPVRTVMTEGVAGIGKTVLTQKFALDWAEGKNNQDIQFTFPFSFRGLNMVKEKKFSLVELIHLFFPEIKEAGICRFDHFRVLFIFDGLDECRFALDLKTKEVLTDVTQSASLEVLLANLIKGRLLPSARVWITTRPAAAHLIPPEFVDLMTEVRGFNDPQKEEYFRKRFTEEEESKMVLSHIKSSRSLYIMCHIPVFCWVIATVLEDAINAREQADLPNSLTDMYILFLVVLSKVKNVKYDKNVEKDPLWTPETRDMIQSLGKLAFEQLMKGNLFFYESDLTECGIDVRAASVYSGVFTEIFQEERGFFHQNMFCFVHLSIQEFLAALHVHLTFFSTGVNLLAEKKSVSHGSKITDEQYEHFYKTAVEKAIDAPDGKLDLFLRFLFGLSLDTNQRLLHDFVTERKPSSSSLKNIVEYIEKKIEEILCPFDKANLFHCLNELKELSLMTEIEQILKSGKLETENFTDAQWAALIHILLSSEDYEKNFDVRKYYISNRVEKSFSVFILNSTKAVLSFSFLDNGSYPVMDFIFSYSCCMLKDLDLSNNDMKDSGLKLLCETFSKPGCNLETLRLSGCLITKEGCEVLASALASNLSNLKELDLSYNYPEEHGVALLSAGVENPDLALTTLRVEPSGSQFLVPGLRKYAVELILDSTTHRNLTLSEFNRIMMVGQGEKLSWFGAEEELLGRHGLTGRCYWEAEWRGKAAIGVTYKTIRRRGERNGCGLGVNDQSWALLCSKEGFSVLHYNKITKICVEPSSKVGVYVDVPGGTVSFFGVYPDKMTYLHTYNTKFTEPVYPALRIEADPVNSSLTLC